MTPPTFEFNLRELYDVIVDAIIAFDSQQRILYFNRGAEAMFGYRADEIVGQRLDVLLPTRFSSVHRQHFADFAQSPIVSRAMGERRSIFGVTKDGREFPAEAAITKLPRGNDTIYVAVMRDITERKRVESELRLQAEQIAVANERSRLARDLHDAVTQTLFSASVIADVLPRIWERAPDEGRRRLEELRQLNRGALAEMRTLLLELRPAALMEANLSDLLKQLVASIATRSRVKVGVDINGHRDLPPDVKVSLYRIAQEALNNVAKHSNATEATVQLSLSETSAQLIISDNGAGFDTAINKPAHLGLDIMRERATMIGARLQIVSAIGEGTAVWVDAQLGESANETRT
jgi:PAS domain S-box-containing protein